MEKSIYFEYGNRYLAPLVLSITEKLNGSNEAGLSYLFKQLLTPEYSVDGRWETLTGQYTRVAADVVAMDSELPLKKRDSLSRMSGDLPKIGMELFLNEKQMSDIDALITQGLDINAIVQKIFADLPRVIAGIYERMEYMFLQGLSTGVALAEDDNNVGTGIRVDYGYFNDNKFGATTQWTGNVDTAKAIDDIGRVIKKAQADGNTIIGAYADSYWFDAFCANKQVREQFAFLQGFVGTSIPILTVDQANAVLSNRFGFTVQKVDRTIKIEKNGVRANKKPWEEGTIVFVCNQRLGSVVWTRCAEMNHPVAGVLYQTADQYILTSKYRVNRPALREYTSSQARVVPVISNPDQIYTLNIKTIQA